MVQVTNLSKSYGNHQILDSISFNINAGERIGLVGRNGHGKTTLFRLILGEEEIDGGNISIPKNYTIGCLDQHIRFTQNTVLKEACLGLPPEQKNDFWRAEKLLSGLGFSESDMQKSPGIFSGGFQVRIQLVKVLVRNPSLLLLDEPTNYLDIVSLRWLERFLNSWKNELILITHDRSFMDSVCTHTMAIHRKKIRKVVGSTDKLYQQLIQEEEIYEKTRINDEKRKKEIELFITRFRAKARLGGLVQSRVKLLDKKEKMDKLEKIKTLEFSFNEEPFTGKWTVEAQNISFSYNSQKPYLIENFSMLVGNNDRIGIIGKNGKGKSTLIRLLSGELVPLSGNIKQHPQLKTGYFGQTNIERLHHLNTVEDEILSADPEHRRQLARNIAGAMLFEEDLALKKISVLSGGEKSRVMLGKILITPSQLLLLDEPTNHLDMESCDSLIGAIDSFNGAVMIVTHNEMYLNALVNRLIVFDKGKVSIYEGSYDDFLKDVGWESEEEEKEKETVSVHSRKAQRKARAEINEEKSKFLKPMKIKINQLEENISQLENELHLDNAALIEASVNSNGEAIAALSKKIKDNRTLIDKLYSDLSNMTLLYETEDAKFNMD